MEVGEDLVARLKTTGQGAFRRTMRGVVTDVKSAGAASSRSGAQARSAGSSFRVMGREAASAGTSLRRQVAGVAAFTGGVYAAQRAVKGIVGTGLSFNASLETNQATYATLLGSQKASVKLQGQLFKLAAKTPFSQLGINDAAKQLLAFQFSGKQVIPTLRSIANFSSAFGGDQERISQVVRSLGQIKAKGVLQGDEVLQLQEAGVNARKYLGQAGLIPKVQRDTRQATLRSAIAQAKYNAAVKRYGKYSVQAGSAQASLLGAQRSLAKAQNPKRVDLGSLQLKSGKAIKAILTGLDRDYGKMAKRQSRTFSGQLSTLKDNMSQMAGSATRPLFDALRKDAFPTLNAFVTAENKIFGRRDLSLAEKFTLTRAQAKKTFQPWLDELKRMHLGDKFGDAVEAGIPIVADRLAQAAPQVANTFITAFLGMSTWGKLLTVGALGIKLGGWRALGGLAASRFAGRFGTSIGPAMTRRQGRMTKGLNGFAVGAGTAIGAVMAYEAARQFAKDIPALNQYSGKKGWGELWRDVKDWAPGEDSESKRRRRTPPRTQQERDAATHSGPPRRAFAPVSPRTQGIPSNPAATSRGQRPLSRVRDPSQRTAPRSPFEALQPQWTVHVTLDGKDIEQAMVKRVRSQRARTGNGG